MSKNLYQKIWDLYEVKKISETQSQLFIGLHLVHEVTSPQAFGMLRDRGLPVAYPQLTFATVDHIIPTTDRSRPLKDPLAEEMFCHLDRNANQHGIRYFEADSGDQGIVHVIGPELGLTRPGTTIVCGDSHTSTHGAFGALAFGIGTSQVRDVLATQTLLTNRLKVRRIQIDGELAVGVTAKDVILHVIRLLGVKGGQGYAYEYAGSAVDGMSMDERMTLCNMSIEGGARCGYVNPDKKTFDYLSGRRFSPRGDQWSQLVSYWQTLKSDEDAGYDDIVKIDASSISTMVTWGISPGQSVGIGEKIPEVQTLRSEDRLLADEAFGYMGLSSGDAIEGFPIDVAFIGSCTNGRLSDFLSIAPFLEGKKVAPHVKAIAVPGSEAVDRDAKKRGIDQIFRAAGFEWRTPGCSMCLAMNPDKLVGRQVCASSSNRNFKGRQGSASGRTLLMSPLTVAASAIGGSVSDPKKVFGLKKKEGV